MLAKLVDATIDPTRLDHAVAAVDAELIPAFLDLDGALQGYWAADVRTGHVLAITMWRDADALRSAAASDGAMRATVGERIGLSLRSVHALPVLACSPGAEASEVARLRLDWLDHVEPVWEEGPALVGCSGRYWLGEDHELDGCLLSLWPDAAPSGDAEVTRRLRRAGRTRRSRSVREYRTFGVACSAAAATSTTELAGV